MAGATSIIKYISRFGITAAKNKFGTSKSSGVGQLTDEQLGQGLNKFEAKKAEDKSVKAPKDKPTPKPKSPPRNVEGAATQRGLRFRDKPEVDIEVESDASRSVSETNQARGAASAGRSTNAPGKTNIGSKSIANFIKDQMAMSPGMQARSKQDNAFARMIRNAKTKKEKEALQEALNKIREKRRRADAKQAATTARKSAQTRTGQTRQRRTDYVTQDGEIIGKPTKEQVNAAMRNAEARDDSTTATRMRRYLKELSDKEQGKGQLESAGARTIDTSDRMIQDAKKSLVAVFGQKKGTELFNKILKGSNTKKQFLVEIRSMVQGGSKGQSTGTRPSETGAIVGNRKSNLRLVDRSNKEQPGRREATSRRGKPGNTELDSPMNRGGKVTKRATGAHDFRMNKGGLLLSSVDNRKKR